jgi:hypothetical protein
MRVELTTSPDFSLETGGLLLEDGGYLLLEDGGKLLLEV